MSTNPDRTVDTKKVEILLIRHGIDVWDVLSKAGMSKGRYTTLIHVKNNSGNIGAGQREAALKAYADAFDCEVEDLYVKKKATA